MVLRLLGTHKSPKVVASCHDLKFEALEEGLCLRDVPGRHNQDALGWLWEVALWGPSHHQIIQVTPDPLKGAARPSVIHIPFLGDSGLGLPQLCMKGRITSP